MLLEGRKAKYGVAIAVAVAVILSIAYMLYVATTGLIGGGCAFRPDIELGLKEEKYGWFVFEVTGIYRGEREQPEQKPTADRLEEVYSLSDIHMALEFDGDGVNFTESWTTLAEAEANFWNRAYAGDVVFFDADADGLISEGDLLMIKGVENGGVFQEDYSVVLYSIAGGGHAGGYLPDRSGHLGC